MEQFCRVLPGSGSGTSRRLTETGTARENKLRGTESESGTEEKEKESKVGPYT